MVQNLDKWIARSKLKTDVIENFLLNAWKKHYLDAPVA